MSDQSPAAAVASSADAGSGSVPAIAPLPSPGVSAPVSSTSSPLGPDAAQAKALAQTWMRDPNSPYWRGSETATAEQIQTAYRDLIRGELAGQPTAIGPEHEVDVDRPRDVSGYDFSNAPGARSIGADDRAVIDAFLPAALEVGLGQAKVNAAIGWALTTPNATPESFRQFAEGAGWSDRSIEACLAWFNVEQQRRGGR